MAALLAAMLAFDGNPLPYQVPLFRAKLNRNAYEQGYPYSCHLQERRESATEWGDRHRPI
jgi:hypothetical protein